MHVAKYYAETHKLAYVILGHCKDFGQQAYEAQLLEVELKITLPLKTEFNVIALGQYQGMTIIKFPLDEKTKIRRPGHEPPWLPIAMHLEKLKPRF
jgi:hypothetical protein